MGIWILLFTIVSAGAAPMTSPLNCGCPKGSSLRGCGVRPAFLTRNSSTVLRDLGFDIPKDHEQVSQAASEDSVLRLFARFLENSDHARALNPGYYTRAAKDASMLTLRTTFTPKNPNETDEYFRCILPGDKYCLYRNTLRPYLGLAAKASGIPYSFLACQSYVESRFNRNARSSVGAIGYAQIKETNVRYLNEVLHRSIRRSYHEFSGGRSIASVDGPRATRIKRAQHEIADIWTEFWKGTKNAPKRLAKCDLTCYRQVFLAQALSIKTDMLALATSSRGLKADYDENGDFRIEKMDQGDSLLLLAGSYNVGVSNMIRLISHFCSHSTKIKDCLDHMTNGTLSDPARERARKRDVRAFTDYIMRIRDCAQRFSAEQIDFDDDARWSADTRIEKKNEQRDEVVQCLANPCPYPRAPASINTGQL